MRILFVADTLGSGGKERQLVELLKGLDKQDDVTYTLCLLSRTVHYDDAKTLRGEVHFIDRKFRYDPRVFRKLSSVFRKFRPDVVQSWELMCSVYALPVARRFGVPFVSMIRNAPAAIPAFSSTWMRSRLTFPFSDLVLSNSRAGLEAYGIHQRSRCIHNGFDFRRTEQVGSPGEMRERFGIHTPFVVGMVGKFHPKKDNETFVRAALESCGRRSDVTFVAIGDGVKLNRCRALVGPEFRSRILFPGKQEHVEQIVNAFDIGVLATFTEGISNSIMEYMALSKPVIATEGGGTNELVVDGETGFLVPGGDPSAIAAKIDVLLDNPIEKTRMGKTGRKRLEDEFNLGRMTREFIEAYRSCIPPESRGSVAGELRLREAGADRIGK